MNRLAAIICSLAILLGCNQPNKQQSGENTETYLRYKTELKKILYLDQKYRLLSDSLEQIYEWDSDTLQEIYKTEHIQDSLNLIGIERIIAEIGWPKRSVLGDSASDAAFLVLQHCGKAAIMQKYLQIMIESANKNDLAWSNLALYIDRIKMLKSEKQIYGTQIVYNDSLQKLMVYPVEDMKNIDSLRHSVGLIPISEHLKKFGIENVD